MSRPPDLFDETKARAVAWLTAWDSQGHHRTGTTGDETGALWLEHEAAGFGVDVAAEAFTLKRLDPVACYLELDGERISAVPAFDAPGTGASGVIGTLSLSDREDAILVAQLSPRSVYTGEYDRLRRNAAHRSPPWHAMRPPRSSLTSAAARNVVVAISGSRRFLPPVVVMTPRSSWWQSTAERRGGIVCWLESLRALVATPPACDVFFTANSGHELGHLGLDDFIARRPGWERPISAGGATWVHFGANLGAADGELCLQSASDDLGQLTEFELGGAGQTPDVVAPKTLVPSGETRDIHRAGGRYVTLVGSNSWFHLPQDRWPHAVDIDAVTRVATAAAALVVKLTR